MWSKVNFQRLAIQLLPPLLRSPLLAAIIKALCTPIRYLYAKFATLKLTTDDRIGVTGQVVSLEGALNRALHLNGLIYIESADEEDSAYFYYAEEDGVAQTMHTEAEGVPYVMGAEGEAMQTPNFTVMVPTTVCTSLESADDDVCQWEHLNTIVTIVNTYKPAGATYGITLYTYE
jgi:hypothetical protein